MTKTCISLALAYGIVRMPLVADKPVYYFSLLLYTIAGYLCIHHTMYSPLLNSNTAGSAAYIALTLLGILNIEILAGFRRILQRLLQRLLQQNPVTETFSLVLLGVIFTDITVFFESCKSWGFQDILRRRKEKQTMFGPAVP